MMWYTIVIQVSVLGYITHVADIQNYTHILIYKCSECSLTYTQFYKIHQLSQGEYCIHLSAQSVIRTLSNQRPGTFS